MREYRRIKAALQCLEQQAEAVGFADYWERFGYRIGGPVCWGYTSWIADEIAENHPEITDIAFVARDGWLLKRIYEQHLGRGKCGTHYVYASRLLAERYAKEPAESEYRTYLASLGMGDGVIAVVDTATVGFSSQRLISSCTKNGTYGFFWTATRGGAAGKGLEFSTFQKKSLHVIRTWDLMEFIMTSPEPPLMGLEDGTPIYGKREGFEAKRERLFAGIERGVLRFAEDIVREDKQARWNCELVTEWVNDFLEHPQAEDIAAFEDVKVSARVDHADQLSLNPFGREGLTQREIKNRLWLLSTSYPLLYRVLHSGNAARRKLISKVHHSPKQNSE